MNIDIFSFRLQFYGRRNNKSRIRVKQYFKRKHNENVDSRSQVLLPYHVTMTYTAMTDSIMNHDFGGK